MLFLNRSISGTPSFDVAMLNGREKTGVQARRTVQRAAKGVEKKKGRRYYPAERNFALWKIVAVCCWLLHSLWPNFNFQCQAATPFAWLRATKRHPHRPVSKQDTASSHFSVQSIYSGRFSSISYWRDKPVPPYTLPSLHRSFLYSPSTFWPPLMALSQAAESKKDEPQSKTTASTTTSVHLTQVAPQESVKTNPSKNQGT